MGRRAGRRENTRGGQNGGGKNSIRSDIPLIVSRDCRNEYFTIRGQDRVVFNSNTGTKKNIMIECIVHKKGYGVPIPFQVTLYTRNID